MGLRHSLPLRSIMCVTAIESRAADETSWPTDENTNVETVAFVVTRWIRTVVAWLPFTCGHFQYHGAFNFECTHKNCWAPSVLQRRLGNRVVYNPDLWCSALILMSIFAYFRQHGRTVSVAHLLWLTSQVMYAKPCGTKGFVVFLVLEMLSLLEGDSGQ